MLKHLRWKFIGTASVAVFIVLAVLVAGINLVYRHITVSSVDRMLEMIGDNQGRFPEIAPGAAPPAPWGFDMTPETPFETRFFVVWRDAGSGEIRAQTEHIASVSGEDAESFYRKAASAGKQKGFVAQYRFLRTQSPGGAA